MDKHKITSNDLVEKFWDKYIILLNKQGVKESAARWYVKRAEDYIKSFPDKKLAQHTAEDITGYLEHWQESIQLHPNNGVGNMHSRVENFLLILNLEQHDDTTFMKVLSGRH
jgi:hypothetical protein